MKNFVSFMLKAIALLAILAAAAYWLNYFLTAAGKKECCLKALFTKKAAPVEIEPEPIPEPASSCGCGDAVCAVDMCMPY